MRKIPTLFQRDPDDRKRVVPIVPPSLRWVLAGEGVPSRKWDGTAEMLDNRGRWFARREVRLGKDEPVNFQAVQRDEVTGTAYGWVPIAQSPFAQYHDEAVRNLGTVARPGTYELVGPKVNGNHDGAPQHALLPHGGVVIASLAGLIYPDEQAAFDSLREFLTNTAMEGVVWAHPDGRRAKLKGRDFPDVDA